MSKKIIWLVVSGLMALSLLVAACEPAATPATPTAPTTPTSPAAPTSPTTSPITPTTPVEKGPLAPAAEVPKYGGTLTLVQTGDVTRFDTWYSNSGTIILGNINQPLWSGDWAKGIAGGFGTKESDWGAGNNDFYNLKTGFISESTKWTLDTAKDEGTIVYQIRQGVHFALNPASEASRLVNGREVTADDVVFNLKRVISPGANLYGSNIELRTANITKTGTREITVRLPISAMVSGITRFTSQVFMMAPEVVAKWGPTDKWGNSVGTGPFMLTEYTPGSVIIMKRNANYWQTDPVGPGKGNQLPYLDVLRYLIIPDASTRLSALRTGKIDQMQNLTLDDDAQLRKTTPHLLEKENASNQGRGDPAYMRTDKVPFNDVRVRRAMMVAIDFQSILQSLYKGRGQFITFPISYIPDYGPAFLGLDDPDMPASVKELYSYNSDKARQLLKEAGYPNGFKTSVVLLSTEVDYWSIIKDMWAKVGIDLKLDVKETGVKNTILDQRSHEALITDTTGPVSGFYLARRLQGGLGNSSMVDDPYINDMIEKMRTAAITDLTKSMLIHKELMKYVLDKAYAIPNVIGSNYTLWQPWIKNYSGEWTFGGNVPCWPQYIWYDEALKKSMGY